MVTELFPAHFTHLFAEACAYKSSHSHLLPCPRPTPARSLPTPTHPAGTKKRPITLRRSLLAQTSRTALEEIKLKVGAPTFTNLDPTDCLVFPASWLCLWRLGGFALCLVRSFVGSLICPVRVLRRCTALSCICSSSTRPPSLATAASRPTTRSSRHTDAPRTKPWPHSTRSAGVAEHQPAAAVRAQLLPGCCASQGFDRAQHLRSASSASTLLVGSACVLQQRLLAGLSLCCRGVTGLVMTGNLFQSVVACSCG